MSSMVRAVCWKCDEVFPSTRERKNHMANKVHNCLRVLCPWCPRERMYRRSTPELKDHTKREHRADYESVTSACRDFFSEANGFWLAMYPRDYGQLVEPTPYNAQSSIKARELVTIWMGKTPGRKEQLKAWENGWKLYDKPSARTPKRRRESPEPESSFIPDYEDDLPEAEAKRSKEEYTPDKPEIKDVLILHSVNNKGQLTAILHTEDQNVWYSCLIKKDLDQDPKAIASFFRRMSTIKGNSDVESPAMRKLLGQSHITMRNSISETLGIPNKFIERITYGIRYETTPQDKTLGLPVHTTPVIRTPTPVTSNTGNPSTPSQSVFVPTQSAYVPSESQSAFIPVDLSSSPFVPATSSTTKSPATQPVNLKPIIHVQPSPIKITSSCSPLNLTFQPFRQTPSPNLTLQFLTSPSPTTESQPIKSINQEPLNLTSKKAETNIPTQKLTTEGKPGKASAIELLRKGVMPMLPPAKRDWTTVSPVLLCHEGTQLFWPPENWKSLSPDAKLFAWELAAFKFSATDDTCKSFNMDRTTLLAKYNMLALPGTAMPTLEKERESEVYMRIGNYRMIAKIAASGTKNNTEKSFLEMLKMASQLRNTSTDWLTNILDEMDVKLRLPK